MKDSTILALSLIFGVVALAAILKKDKGIYIMRDAEGRVQGIFPLGDTFFDSGIPTPSTSTSPTYTLPTPPTAALSEFGYGV